MRKLVEDRGADMTVRLATGETLVMLAVLSGRTEVLTYLLSRRFHGMIDLEAKDANGYTALMLACNYTLNAIELLLQSGADPRKNETTGHCPVALLGGNDAQKNYWLVAARAEPERERHLYRVRCMLERMPEPESKTTTTSIETKESIFTTITTSVVTPKPVVTVGRHGKRKRKREWAEKDEVAGEDEEEEEGRLVGVIEYVVGRDGSGKGRMLDAHFVELMDMMLPSWDPERTRG